MNTLRKFFKKKIAILFCFVLIIFLGILLKQYLNNYNIQKNKNILSYSQYIELMTFFKENMSFTTIPMEFLESTLENPYIIIVNHDMSFDKKNYLTLNNDSNESTQYIIIFKDLINEYKLVTSWIYTEVNQDNNLLYLRQNDEENGINDFNSIISYNNILIHLQLVSISSNNQLPESFVKENAYVLTEIIEFLKNYNSN